MPLCTRYIENERFTVGCSCCRLNLKFGNMTLSFRKLRLDVQHDSFFFSFIQSDHCFLVFPLPSSLAKFPVLP